MKKALIIMLVGVLIAVIGIGSCIGWYVKTADSINEMYNYVKKTEADVQTQLQSRFDQVPNLVEIVKGAEKHEQGIIDSITAARTQYNKAFSVGDTNGMLEANESLNLAISKFEENYPEVTTTELYKDLMDEYSEIETTLEIARLNYNEAVMEYNNLIGGIINSFIARSRGYERFEEFKATNKANSSIVIDMTQKNTIIKRAMVSWLFSCVKIKNE